MKTTLTILLSGILVLPLSGQDTADERQETAVRQAITRLGTAFLEADIEELKGLLAEEYLHVNGGSGSVLNRNQWLGWMESRRAELAKGMLIIRLYEIEKLQVNVLGNAAVATGVVTSNGTRSGKEFTSRIRFTNTWVLQDGEWRRAAFHDSAIANPTK